MAELIQSENELTDLSEQEQATLSGGLKFFLQTTEIDTSADYQSALAIDSEGSLSSSTAASTDYRFQQTTLAFDTAHSGRGGRRVSTVLGRLFGLLE